MFFFSLFFPTRVHQRLWEDVLCLPAAGASCQTLKHHERDQPSAHQAAHDTLSANGAELVSGHAKTELIATCQTWCPCSCSSDSLWTASTVLYLIRQQLRCLFTSSRSVLFSAVADESELNSFQLALLWGREALGPELSPSFSPSHVTLFFKRVLFPLVWPKYRPERRKKTFEGNI